MASVRRERLVKLAELLEIEVESRTGNVALMEVLIGAAEDLPEVAGYDPDEDDTPQETGIVLREAVAVEAQFEPEADELAELGGEDERAVVELSRLSRQKLAEDWTGRPAQKQVLVNILHGRGFSREQRQQIAEAMDGHMLGELRFIVARFTPAGAEPGASLRLVEAAPEPAPEPAGEVFQLAAPVVKKRRRRAS